MSRRALMPLSPSQGLPGWIRSRPFLFSSTLRWLNIHRRYRFLLPVGIVLLLAAAGLLTLPDVGRALTVGVAYLVGSLVGWLLQGGSDIAAPAFHYVTVRKPREQWAQAPRLEPLSYWAIGQTRAIAKPQVAASTMLLVLVAIPLGPR